MAGIELDCRFDSFIVSCVDQVVGIWPFRVIGNADSVGACSEDRQGGLPNINKALSPIGGICSLLASIPRADSIGFALPKIDYKRSEVSLKSHLCAHKMPLWPPYRLARSPAPQPTGC